MLDPKVPPGPLKDKWDDHKFNLKLVNPSNRRKYRVIVVGTGLAGASAAAAVAKKTPIKAVTVLTLTRFMALPPCVRRGQSDTTHAAMGL